MHRLARITTYLCVVLTLLFATSPLVRGYFCQNLNYNEGWNIYNAIRFGDHQQLYPPGYSWTTNNYPMLSFVLMSELHKLTGEYLFTGRAVSLLSTVLLCLFVCVLLKELGATGWASTLAALFCFSLFAINTAYAYAIAEYINAYDPEMLGLMVFIGGLVLYLFSKRPKFRWLLPISAITIAAGISIKHSSIAVLLALFIDCACSSLKRLGAFLAFLTPCILVSLYLHLHYGGPWFFQALLEKRVYEFARAFHTFLALFMPICIPALCAFVYAFWKCRAKKRRIIPILVFITTLLGFYFGSAQGVSINCFFELMVALSIALGMWFSDIDMFLRSIPSARLAGLAAVVPLVLFLLLLIPCEQNGYINPYAVWQDSLAAQAETNNEVRFMARRPGPALCLDLLPCYLAGKPYIYDPFNATRLIRLGHLDENQLVNSVRNKEFSSIEIRATEMEMAEHNYRSERFAQNVLLAIRDNYRIGYSGRQYEEIRIYVPKT